ncbi:hypothetical protein ANOM_008891 [Aspergillus nomiae NRRL 13137]|uniref:Store-operated calcium entry-associated regulatory factor n=1 Tax=Aspergillus nomiae NRRL (strain ATCC 15546 / NRRL 13137 / CBS 260.88 / M93) TaxID=1509407 RepID=A0A0L1IQH5_ASPN3|nr:uncharacterized protein ANOM_008891 [Aspergillus nomiae NRRL 13137]KNG81846.1 hypothetical protein ANOM_008891 [Aspergillus nomiae NRRL 13137]
MYSINLQALLSFLLLVLPVLSYGRNPPGNNAILLSNVQTLTLRGNRLTTSRRVDPIPQLKCTGPSKRICDLYPIDVMRCTNAGYDYDEEDVQWTCTASLPQEFKLGSTDVVCEGYRNADDKWVLKGSCGVEYRLLLTELGERKFGRRYVEHVAVREETEEAVLLVVGLVVVEEEEEEVEVHILGLHHHIAAARIVVLSRRRLLDRAGGPASGQVPWVVLRLAINMEAEIAANILLLADERPPSADGMMQMILAKAARGLVLLGSRLRLQVQGLVPQGVGDMGQDVS